LASIQKGGGLIVQREKRLQRKGAGNLVGGNDGSRMLRHAYFTISLQGGRRDKPALPKEKENGEKSHLRAKIKIASQPQEAAGERTFVQIVHFAARDKLKGRCYPRKGDALEERRRQ